MLEGLGIFLILTTAVCLIGHIFGPYKTYSATPKVWSMDSLPDLRLAHWTQAERDSHLMWVREQEHIRADTEYRELQWKLYEDAQQRQVDAYWAKKRENWVNGEPDKEVPPVRPFGGVDEMRRLSQSRPSRVSDRYHRKFPMDYYRDRGF